MARSEVFKVGSLIDGEVGAVVKDEFAVLFAGAKRFDGGSIGVGVTIEEVVIGGDNINRTFGGFDGVIRLNSDGIVICAAASDAEDKGFGICIIGFGKLEL